MLTKEKDIFKHVVYGNWNGVLRTIPSVTTKKKYNDVMKACCSNTNITDTILTFVLADIFSKCGFHVTELNPRVAALLFCKIQPLSLEYLFKMKKLSERNYSWFSFVLSVLWQKYRVDKNVTVATDIMSEDKLLCLETRTTIEKTKIIASCGHPNQENIFHEIIKCGCDDFVIDVLLKGDSTVLMQEDSSGNFPLHHAASLPLIASGQTCWEDPCPRTRKDSLEVLLEYNPSVANRFNKIGRSPLFIYLDRSKSEEMDEDGERKTLALLKAAPKMLEFRDPVTSLYPFMMASKGKSSNKRSEILEMTVIFKILLMNPSVFEKILTKDYYKAELAKKEKKIAALFQDVAELQREIDGND